MDGGDGDVMTEPQQSSESDAPVVLLVDDNPDIQTVLGIGLEHHGYRSFGATSVKNAMAVLASCRPSIVLIDQGLPDGEGIDLGLQIQNHSHGNESRLFLFSGNYDPELAAKAEEAGFEHFFVKPIRMAELLAKIS